MADSKTTPILFTLVALAVGYAGYSGEGISLVGMNGLKSRTDRVAAIEDTVTQLQAKIDTAKRDLAKESVEDVTKRVEAYRASLAVLRTLVPEQREVANLIDDIQIRAKVRGLTVSAFTPEPPVPGPAPFDTYTYKLSVIGRYHQVGAFLTDIASLRRIMVAGEVRVAGADLQKARVLGDTVAMLEASFKLRTYVKAKAPEDSTNVP